MFAVMGALCAGASLAVRPRFSAGSFFDDAARFGATGCTFVGTVLAILAARHAGERRDHGLRFAFGGGAPLDVWRAVEARFGMRIHEAYGMTEAGGWTSANTVDAYRFGSCGRPRDDIEGRCLGHDDRPLPAGTEIACGRVNRTHPSGYYKSFEQPSQRAQILVPYRRPRQLRSDGSLLSRSPKELSGVAAR